MICIEWSSLVGCISHRDWAAAVCRVSSHTITWLVACRVAFGHVAVWAFSRHTRPVGRGDAAVDAAEGSFDEGGWAGVKVIPKIKMLSLVWTSSRQ